jgi:hypothetical protein
VPTLDPLLDRVLEKFLTNQRGHSKSGGNAYRARHCRYDARPEILFGNPPRDPDMTGKDRHKLGHQMCPQ